MRIEVMEIMAYLRIEVSVVPCQAHENLMRDMQAPISDSVNVDNSIGQAIADTGHEIFLSHLSFQARA